MANPKVKREKVKTDGFSDELVEFVEFKDSLGMEVTVEAKEMKWKEQENKKNNCDSLDEKDWGRGCFTHQRNKQWGSRPSQAKMRWKWECSSSPWKSRALDL